MLPTTLRIGLQTSCSSPFRIARRWPVSVVRLPTRTLYAQPFTKLKYPQSPRRFQAGPTRLHALFQRTFSTSFRRHASPTAIRRLQYALNRVPSNHLIYWIIGINVVVLGAWQWGDRLLRYERDPKLLKWMYQNFTSSWRNLLEGRIWVELTSIFSHQDLMHAAFNLFTLYFMGPIVVRMLGPARFLVVYIGGGLMASFGSLLYRINDSQYQALGASGALYSAISFLACAAPRMTFMLYGIVPVPAWLAVSGIFAYDAFSTLRKSGGQTDTVAHCIGLASGAAFYLAARGGRF
ncbi:hypothetical protein DL96DRAFT_1813323 [Flagelloscypha sp. PMI_526]|nr:hypothetical protein DL96DRAFT_1813323 [Flagelloscypha sp. PMI_526]